MAQISNCLFNEHDLRMVALAALVCLLASWTAISLGRRAARDGRLAWIAAAGFVAGTGIWTTHFVAMLAFDPGAPVSYDVGLTALSVLVAIVGGSASFLVVALGGPIWATLGGVVLGLDIGAMHYLGMRAANITALVEWNASLVQLSLAIGAILAGAALRVSIGAVGRGRRTVGILLLVLAICGLHFTGMGALRVVPLAGSEVLEPFRLWWLAGGLVATTLAILGFALAAMLLESHLRLRDLREQGRLQTLVDVAFEGVLILQDGVIADTNDSFLKLVAGSRDTVVGRPADEFILRPVSAGETSLTGSDALNEAKLRRRDGASLEVEILSRSIDYHGRPADVIAVRDVTERRASERKIHHLAFHDPLTDLPNRRLFRDALERTLSRPGGSATILCIDLDRFKVVNDTLGHKVGDSLLRSVADRLQQLARSSDVIARLGADEFAIIRQDPATQDDAVQLCRRVLSRVSEPFEIDGHLVTVGASIGGALVSPGTDAEEALKRADLALFRAKHEGRQTWRFFEPSMDEALRNRHQLELDLRAAVRKRELLVFYQPLVEVTSGNVTGFEALLRWRHPIQGFISPGVFIPIAEEINLIEELGLWVLRQACVDARQWPGERTVSVNMSVAQFRPGLPEQVRQILLETDLPAERLMLEVTESLFVGAETHAFGILRELRALGVKIAMDDFGTGYSSLSYLRRFPFDKLKIDQSFIRDSNLAQEDRAIIDAVVQLGHTLGMQVNAEGVETAEQLALLRLKGCDEAQGFWFSRPVPQDEVFRILETARGRQAALA